MAKNKTQRPTPWVPMKLLRSGSIEYYTSRPNISQTYRRYPKTSIDKSYVQQKIKSVVLVNNTEEMLCHDKQFAWLVPRLTSSAVLPLTEFRILIIPHGCRGLPKAKATQQKLNHVVSAQLGSLYSSQTWIKPHLRAETTHSTAGMREHLKHSRITNG